MPNPTAHLPETQRKARGHRYYAPQAEQKKVPALYATAATPLAEKTLGLHYFGTSADWYVAEMDTETGECFGLSVVNGMREWGYFSLPALEAIRPRSTFSRTGATEGVIAVGTLRWVVERDCHWTPTTQAALEA